MGGFPSHIILAMSTPQDPNKRDQPPAKAKHIRPVNISIPVYTGMIIRKVVPDVVDANPYKRSTLLNVYMRFVEKQIKAMVVPLCD